MNGSDMSNTLRTDWARIDAMTDEEIDTSDISPMSKEFLAKAQWRVPTSSLTAYHSLRLWFGRMAGN